MDNQHLMNNAVLPFTPLEKCSVSDAQCIIDGIFASESTVSGSNTRSDDNVLENINHINLDESEKFVQSAEIHSARIIPKKSFAKKQQKNISEIFLETQFVKEGKDFYIVSRSILKKIGVLSYVFLSHIDKKCERLLTSYESTKDTELNQKVYAQHVVAYGPIQSTKSNPYFSKKRILIKIPIVHIESQKEVAKCVFNIKRSKIATENLENNRKAVKSMFVFMQCIKIVYTEIRFGGRLNNIDSI